jgi:hypothetical protein
MTLGASREDTGEDIRCYGRKTSKGQWEGEVRLTRNVITVTDFWLAALERSAAKGHDPSLLC